jgi:pimeloyl-ACP methyl ester carboxylesterase
VIFHNGLLSTSREQPFKSLGSGVLDMNFMVKEIGSFHVGGGEVVVTGQPLKQIPVAPGGPVLAVELNGEFEAGQAYAQFVRLAQPRSSLPILFWHGGGQTGVTYETKPDGKPGWQQFFLENGFDTYLVDATERGRASWANYGGEPYPRSKAAAWDLFRFGPKDGWNSDPARRKPFADLQFPIAHFDQMAKQSGPMWTVNNDATQKAYDELVRKVGPCIIVAHSHGGQFAYASALHNPDIVKALVLIEPSSAPNPEKSDAAAAANVPTLTVWGDYLDQFDLYKHVTDANRKWQHAIEDVGGTSDWLDLPALGIRGNSHMIMWDDNSNVVADMMLDWLGRQGLA